MLIKKMKSNIGIFILLFVITGSVSHAQLVNPVVALTGSVIDAVSKDPITAIMVVTDESGKRVNATRSNGAENGNYYITSLKPGHKYTVTVSNTYYLKEKYEIEISNTYQYTELSHDFLIVPLAKDTKIPLTVPPFELNKSKLRYGADYVLENIKSTMAHNPNVKFEIFCYPDNDDNPAENETLTRERSKSIEKYFIAQGIDASRITTGNSKKTDPLNPPPTKMKAKGKRYIGTTYIKITDL